MRAYFPMKKSYLLTPGPTVLPESVVTSFAQPILHHRSPEFQKLFTEVKEDIKYVFQTEKDVLILSASGTGAMEAAVCNLFSKGDTVITVNGGKFGDRWAKISAAFGVNAVELKVERGQSASLADIKKLIEDNPKAKAVLFQAHETSTGAVMPSQEIAKLCQEKGLLSVCDAITATGAFNLPMDEWGLDVVISGSQKAMMIPPGLAFIALSDKAWKATETADLPHFYFDLQKERKALQGNQTAWTPAVSLIQGLKEALRLIHEEGLENRFKRHATLAKATRAGVSALGLDLLTEEMSPSVTAVRVPDSIKDGGKIPSIMREKYGVTIAGGQDELKGKIIRMSHFGHIGEFDITTGLACLELTLHDLGYEVKFGASVGAALKVFSEEDMRS